MQENDRTEQRTREPLATPGVEDALGGLSLDEVHTPSVLVDADGRVRQFNAAARDLWGLAPQQVLDQPVDRLLPLGEAQESLAGEGYREVLIRRPDGADVRLGLQVGRVGRGVLPWRLLQANLLGAGEPCVQDRLLSMAVNFTDRPMVILDVQRRIVYVNPAFSELFGYEPGEVLGRHPGLKLICPDWPAAERIRHGALPWGRERILVDARVSDRRGRRRWVSISSSPFLAAGSPEFAGYSVDVLAEITEERAVRELERDALEALASGLGFELFGDFLCRRVRDISPEVRPSIVLIDAQNRLRPWSVSLLPAVLRPAIDGRPIATGVGSCGTAAARGAPVLSCDIANDPLWAPVAELVLPHGLAACWSYPIKRRDASVAGVFAFYSGTPGAPSALHRRVIEACTHFCALAVEREESRRRLEHLVRFDALTGLPNRNGLYRHVDRLLAAPVPDGLSIFSVDIGRLQDIRGMWGYAAGAQALIVIANRLRDQLQSPAFVSRTDGDQFVIVIPGCDVPQATRIASEIGAIAAEPVEACGQQFQLGVNLGISRCPESGDDRDTLLTNATAAMRQAAARGSLYQFFNPEMNELAREQLLMGNALKRAIDTGEGLSLAYQPQIRLDSGRPYGVEALARWCDLRFGQVPPERFVGLAEQTGLVDTLGRWALAEACRQLAEWRASGVAVPAISVNLSPQSFRRADLPDFVAALLAQHALPAASLTLEITERAAMDLTPTMLEVVHRIRAQGVGLSVDDFGMGYSSLFNLASLPVTEVKIDRSFVSQASGTERLHALVEMVVDLGRRLSLVVVAEGVETPSQQAWLRDVGCPVGQGYLFARPLVAAEVPCWVQRSMCESAAGIGAANAGAADTGIVNTGIVNTGAAVPR